MFFLLSNNYTHQYLLNLKAYYHHDPDITCIIDHQYNNPSLIRTICLKLRCIILLWFTGLKL
jgi:hypothetical protein